MTLQAISPLLAIRILSKGFLADVASDRNGALLRATNLNIIDAKLKDGKIFHGSIPVLVIPVFYDKTKTVIINLNRIFIPDVARLLFHSL